MDAAGRRPYRPKYGRRHRRIRAQLAPEVARGEWVCWRCGERIEPGQAWDLGHKDGDASVYMGPEHAGKCNRAAAATQRHARERGGASPSTPTWY